MKKPKKFSRYQLKIALSYLAILMIMLALLNSYPMLISQNFIFAHTRETMAERAAHMRTTLVALENLTPERVSRAMAVLDNQPQYRVVVTDSTGLAVYDNLTTGSIVGRYALSKEIADALTGLNVFHSEYRNAAFDSRYAMPIISGGAIMGVLFLGRRDATQGELFHGLFVTLLFVSILIFAIVVLFSAIISLALTRRISDILGGIRVAYSGKYDFRLQIKGRDELTEVSSSLNRLFSILGQTEELRQRFVSDASHELKTPLSAIRLLADTILETPNMSSAQILEFVADIGAETDRLKHLAERLLELSRLDARLPKTMSAIDPVPCIKRAVRMLSSLADNAGIAISLDLSEDCSVAASEGDLMQIIYNLLENAIKYTPHGGSVKITLVCEDSVVRLSVSDTGVGIPDEALPLIFDRFYRVDEARSREAGGAGLGLSIASESASRIKATIIVESKIGEGSEFIVTFNKQGLP